MKLYIIVINEVFDYQKLQHDPVVCLSKEEADKKLEELFDTAKKHYIGRFDQADRETSGSFSLYPDGCWGTSHYDATLHEVALPCFPLGAVFGERAAREACVNGIKETEKRIDEGAFDGSVARYQFDTERDRDIAADLLDSSDGWLGVFWSKEDDR